MTNEERQQVVVRLTEQIRKLGWEDLIEVKITPADAERGDVDERMARDLVANILKVIRDLRLLDRNLMSIKDADTIEFKSEDSEDDFATEKLRYDRAYKITNQEFNTRNRTLELLNHSLMALEARFDDD